MCENHSCKSGPIAFTIIFSVLALIVGCYDARAQSFPCAAAKMADEAIICQNDTLGKLDVRLDQLYAGAASSVSGSQKRQIEIDQKDWLILRHRCGMDVPCIRHAYEKRIEQLLLVSKSTGLASKILVGSHAGYATIISISGADTDKAIVLFRRELDDLIEECARNVGFKENEDVDARKVSDCAKESVRGENGTIYKRRAMCSKSTIYTEFGNYSMVNTEREAESIIDGKPYRPIRTDWKDHRNEEIVGNCSGCGTPPLIDTFKVLCPASFAAYFDGYTPY